MSKNFIEEISLLGEIFFNWDSVGSVEISWWNKVCEVLFIIPAQMVTQLLLGLGEKWNE